MMNSPFTNRTEFIAANITSGAKTPEAALERLYLNRRLAPPDGRGSAALCDLHQPSRSTPRAAYGDILWAY